MTEDCPQFSDSLIGTIHLHGASTDKTAMSLCYTGRYIYNVIIHLKNERVMVSMSTTSIATIPPDEDCYLTIKNMQGKLVSCL